MVFNVITRCCKGVEEQEMPYEEAYKNIEAQASSYVTGDRRNVWASFAKQEECMESPNLSNALSRFTSESKISGLACELGCGNSKTVIHLLQKGWDVIAVDSSQGALDTLKETANRINPQWILNQKLTLVCHDIETYTFPKNVRLLIASFVLTCCNPLKIREIWDKAYASLEKGGRFIGTFTLTPPTKQQITQLNLMGAWYTDLPTVKALLKGKEYQIENHETFNKFFLFPLWIQFMARK